MSDLSVNSSSSPKLSLSSKTPSMFNSSPSDGVDLLKTAEKKQSQLNESGNKDAGFKVMQAALASVSFSNNGTLSSIA